jgi:hypothetical protein
MEDIAHSDIFRSQTSSERPIYRSAIRHWSLHLLFWEAFVCYMYY